MYNRLLERQLSRYAINSEQLNEGLKSLLLAISGTYDHFEQDRNLLERALEISSSELSDANRKLQSVNKSIDEKNKDLIASIEYARLIQDAIFPSAHSIKSILPNSFLLYKPKEIVSGDFLWLEKVGDKIFIAAVDCTGHGVPGAFMSIVGHNLLNETVLEHKIHTPSEILNKLNEGIQHTLKETVANHLVRDGMDIALCCIHPKLQIVEFAGAYNPLYLVRDGFLREFKADKFPIGMSWNGNAKSFQNSTIEYMPGDMIYLFTDGYADQFGGPNGKKFKYERFQSLLRTISTMPIYEQREILNSEFINWKEDLVQIDDVMVVGIRL